MRKLLATKRAAWGEVLVSLAVGGLATYLNPKIGIPVWLGLLFLGLWLIWRAYKAVPPGIRIKLALRDEAITKCKRGDHSWFNDKRYEDVLIHINTLKKVTLRKPATFVGILKVVLSFEIMELNLLYKTLNHEL